MEPKILEVGSLVEVGTKFEMGAVQGQGRQIADEWTGRVFQVVGFECNGWDVMLAPANLIGADETDAVVTIIRRRLKVI